VGLAEAGVYVPWIVPDPSKNIVKELLFRLLSPAPWHPTSTTAPSGHGMI